MEFNNFGDTMKHGSVFWEFKLYFHISVESISLYHGSEGKGITWLSVSLRKELLHYSLWIWNEHKKKKGLSCERLCCRTQRLPRESPSEGCVFFLLRTQPLLVGTEWADQAKCEEIIYSDFSWKPFSFITFWQIVCMET